MNERVLKLSYKEFERYSNTMGQSDNHFLLNQKKTSYSGRVIMMKVIQSIKNISNFIRQFAAVEVDFFLGTIYKDVFR